MRRMCEAVSKSSSTAFADGYNNTLIDDNIDDMYARTPFAVTCIESTEMDSLLKCLVTPAHHALYIIHHAVHTCGGDFAAGLSHCGNLLKPKCRFAVNSESSGGEARRNRNIHGIDDDLIRPGVHFNAICERNQEDSIVPLGWSVVEDFITTKRLMMIINQRTASADLIRHLESLHRHLSINLGSDIRDKAADVALSLSMVPISTVVESICVNRIIELLCHVASKEIARKRNKSRKSVELLSTCERFAAAGCSGGCLQLVISVAREVAKGLNGSGPIPSQTVSNNLADLNFWSERSLLVLWRKSHTLHKVTKNDFDSALSLEDIILDPPKFDDPYLPLIVDVGCGLGVTLIGLGAMAEGQLSDERSESDGLLLDWSRYNYLGADCSLNATRWASSLTMRMNLSGRCRFLHASAETLMAYVDRAGVKVKMVLVQFPTPYRLKNQPQGGGRNEKLPRSPVDPMFLANETFLEQCTEILTPRDGMDSESYILVQSNCEDVALQLHESLVSRHVVAVDALRPRHTFNGLEVSSRTKSWLRSHDGDHTHHRALGRQWSSEPILPVATETEASCSKHATPVHRCLFKVSL